MFTQPIVTPSLPPISIVELLIVFIIASIAYFIAFNNFDKAFRGCRHLGNHRHFVRQVCILGNHYIDDDWAGISTWLVFSKTRH